MLSVQSATTGVASSLGATAPQPQPPAKPHGDSDGDQDGSAAATLARSGAGQVLNIKA